MDNDQERREYEAERKRLDEMTMDQAIHAIKESVYHASLLFERMENRGKVHGNGHHMAQEIAAAAGKLMQDRWT